MSVLRSAVVLLAATLAMFADVLFRASPEILSDASTDVASQYFHWRAFGFGELRGGNLALWNPHIYLGTPYLGGMQSALLYPPNWIHLVLPLPLALNWGIAAHVFLLGLFVCLWSRQRGLDPRAALLSGLLAMFCGAHFGHVFAGHLSNLCSMVWAPAVLLAVDGWLDRRRAGWLLAGAAGVALLILAGHPQYVFYTAITVVLYGALRIGAVERRPLALLGLLAMGLLGTALAAAQLLPALDAAREAVRQSGVSYEFAASFSLPPESLLSFFVAYPFGGARLLDYWGRAYFWEVGLFVGVGGVMLAFVGALRGESRLRRSATTMALLLLILALGAHTPLFRLLHAFVPGFDSFRGTAKFGFFASLFVCQLAGVGFDRLLREPDDRRRAARWSLVLAAACAVGALSVFVAGAGGEGVWTRFMQGVRAEAARLDEAYLPASRYEDTVFVRSAASFTAAGLGVAAATAGALAVLLQVSRRRQRALAAVALIAVAEVFAAARLERATFPQSAALAGAVDWRTLPNDGEQRILDPLEHNLALSTGALDIWGYDPGVSRRYAEFITATQGGDPDQASQYVSFRALPRIYRMLRLRHALLRGPAGWQLRELPDPLPHLLLLHEARVVAGPDAIFAALAADDFDPRSTAILETVPSPAPERLAPGDDTGETVALLDESTDQLTIEARLSEPGLLLVTDGYSADWTARGLPGSVQSDYDVLPANYVLRAVPLSAGHHLLRLEYAPPGFRRGCWISIGALVACVAALASVGARTRATRRRSAASDGPA